MLRGMGFTAFAEMTVNDLRRGGADAEHAPTAPEVEPEAEAQPDAEAVARELAKLSKLKYDQCRDEEAKRLGVRVKVLDEAVRRYRGEDEAEKISLLFPAVEPSPEPVDGAGLLDYAGKESFNIKSNNRNLK